MIDVESMSVTRVIARVTAVLLLVGALSPIAACGKKGPLYLPTAPSDAPSKKADHPDRERG